MSHSQNRALDAETADMPPAKLKKTAAASRKSTNATEKREWTLADIAAAEENARWVQAQSMSEGDDYEYLVEPFEPIDAGGESADESDNSESARRPSLKATKRFAPHLQDEFEGNNDVYDDDAEYADGMAGLNNADSDEDDPANSPTKRISRRLSSRAAQFTSPISTSVTTKVPAKKKTKGAQSLRQETSEHSGVQIHMSGNTGSATPPPSKPEGSSTSSDLPAQTAAIVSSRAQI
ncbi:hypothetical protein FRB90_009981 [Tulasnella sp. 427]|nr:hypothetical protein FRB90_009981 [Tulasnella sp. 427]